MHGGESKPASRGDMPSQDDDVLSVGQDLEILSRNIQAISSADAVAASRALATTQTPE
jgi:hypothetical protein